MAVFQATVIDDDPFDIILAGKQTHTPQVHAASTPYEADLIVSDPCPVFSSVTVTSLGPTTIRVTFPEPATLNSALVQPGNYVITPSLTVHSVTPESAVDPTYVDLEIDEQTTGVNYEVEVQGVEKA